MSDSVVHSVAAATLAIVFLAGAWHKLRDPAAFEAAIAGYALVPEALATVLARVLPVVELGCALALLYAPLRAAGGVLALALLAGVTLPVILNLLRGHTAVGCGCGGIEDEQPLSWALVARNAGLAALAASALAVPAPRTLLWLDYLTIAAGAASCYGLYVLANQLLANRPRLERLRTLT